VAAINTLGMLEVLEAGDSVQDITDLEGRTVYSTGKGASPEHVLNFLLTSNGLDPATDLTVEYRSEATEVAAMLASEPGAIGVLPQPYVTVLQTQKPDIRTALRLTEEWAAVDPDSQMVTGVLIVRTAFAEAHPEAFADFLTDYAASTLFTTTHPAEAAPLIAAAGIVPSAEVAEAAIPACNITYIEGDELEATLGGYLEVLFEADPASVGGSLPGDDFYYRR
ncbi:MAG TPA: ABC transporter substrate-binding protein, partial [Actinotalea sp.]|nr:ABC transporter substrate-binding protein [Actinotalea sp.]